MKKKIAIPIISIVMLLSVHLLLFFNLTNNNNNQSSLSTSSEQSNINSQDAMKESSSSNVEESSSTNNTEQPTSDTNVGLVEEHTSSELTSDSTSNSTINTPSSTIENTKSKRVLDSSQLLANAGIVAYGVYYFSSQDYLSNNNNSAFISASVIKVFIMDYIFENDVALDTIIDSSSVIQLVESMITVSDNLATNSLIDYIGMETLNNYFQQSGYTSTKLERHMLDEQARASGLDNYTSLSDTMQFLKKVYTNQTQFPYSKMLNILSSQQVRTKIPSQLPSTVTVANKTGELTDVENDIGIVFKNDDPFAIVVLSNNVNNSSSMRTAIGDFALQAYSN